MFIIISRVPHSLRKQTAFYNVTNSFPRNDVWTTRPRCGKCFWLAEANFQPIRSTTQNLVVINVHHQYGISVVICQTSLCRETVSDVTVCRLVTQATLNTSKKSQKNWNSLFIIFLPTNFILKIWQSPPTLLLGYSIRLLHTNIHPTPPPTPVRNHGILQGPF